MKKIFLITITTFCLAANLYSAKKVVVVGDKLNVYSENGSELFEIDLHVQPFDIKIFSEESHADCKSYYDNGKVKRIEYFFRKKPAGFVDFTRTGEIKKAFIIYKTGFETDIYYGGGRQVKEIIKNVGLIRKGYPAEYHYFFSMRGELNRIDLYYKESEQFYILKEDILFEGKKAIIRNVLNIRDEEYRVYSCVIDEFEKRPEKSKWKFLVVQDETTLYFNDKFSQKTVDFFEKESKEKLSKDIIADFSNQNKRPETL